MWQLKKPGEFESTQGLYGDMSVGVGSKAWLPWTAGPSSCWLPLQRLQPPSPGRGFMITQMCEFLHWILTWWFTTTTRTRWFEHSWSNCRIVHSQLLTCLLTAEEVWPQAGFHVKGRCWDVLAWACLLCLGLCATLLFHLYLFIYLFLVCLVNGE